MVSSIDVKAAYATVDPYGDGGFEWDESLAAEFDEWLQGVIDAAYTSGYSNGVYE